MAGISLGGMHTWLCAALDCRVAAAAPMIGVQSFRWALEHDHYHGRVDSLRSAFENIRGAMGRVRSVAPSGQGPWAVMRPCQLYTFMHGSGTWAFQQEYTRLYSPLPYGLLYHYMLLYFSYVATNGIYLSIYLSWQCVACLCGPAVCGPAGLRSALI
jgi:hypothetical protein